uniref:MutT/NUDIX hydrolase n=1 Tax=Ochrobactrum phage ORM_20 TaxID=2985243 RepID=A0A9N6WTS8_9VIRU|nr:MutT/NUDIX hydrolase [Ochrobactrum phage ORM_20]
MDPEYVKIWGKQHVTADNIIWTSRGGKLYFLFIRRKENPMEIALPGGFVEHTETIMDTAVRELMEETGVEMTNLCSYKYAFYEDDIYRDLRARMITHVFAGNILYNDLMYIINEPSTISMLDPEVQSVHSVAYEDFHGYNFRADHRLLVERFIDETCLGDSKVAEFFRSIRK